MNVKVVAETKRLLIKERDSWEFVERKSGKEAVIVLAVTDDGRVLLTEQMRRPLGKRVIEFPAGLVGDEEGGEEPADAARKELKEETGYACTKVELIARGPTTAGISSEVVSFYRARNVRKEGKGGGVSGEDITVHEVPLAEIRAWLEKKERAGLAIDVKIWAGLYWLAVTDNR
ncbi:MAG TPA: NUDIX hydrolase [Thermoanaerobaculia bacterium]|nr:NUDIX hydrolase [Thermoanaerobaculia bacterium]